MDKTLTDRIAAAIDEHEAVHGDTTLNQIFEAFCEILDVLERAASHPMSKRPKLVLVKPEPVKLVRHHDEPQQDHPVPAAPRPRENFDNHGILSQSARECRAAIQSKP
jgi:hypothetical protein